MEPPAAVDLGLSTSHRSFAGHVLSLGVHVFIFGVLAYLTFLNQGGLAGEVLLIYVSALPMTMAIELVRLARAGQKLGAHHIVKGVLTGVVLCGLGGLWVLFPYQIAWGLAGTMAFVWVTMYSPASPILKPPTLRDLTASAPSREGQTLRSITMLAGAVVLLVGGIALTGLAVIDQSHRPGGFSISYTSGT